MKNLSKALKWVFTCFIFTTLSSCHTKPTSPDLAEINAAGFKKGDIVLCGSSEKRFGTVEFEISGSKNLVKDFDLGMALLHSFEYEEAEKVFSKIIAQDPGFALAYWGIAMCNYHPVWTPPTREELIKGAKAIALARSIPRLSKRESAYIEAIGLIYKDWDKTDHRTRSQEYEKAMEEIYLAYPEDKEAAILYSLALDAVADPTDKSYKNQRKAGEILNRLYPGQPDHPGIVHYIIHSYDYPELAILALPAARKYASIAPASAHAQHMPSHIFTRLGLWDEAIQSDLASTSSARCYAENAGIKGHWDEELHGLDYLMYAYLQKGDNRHAKEVADYLQTITDVYPSNFKVAYAFAAIPARYLVENRLWKEAAGQNISPENFSWEKFPWQLAINHFARLLGAVNINAKDQAASELKQLNTLFDTLTLRKDTYNANQVAIQVKTGEAWIAFKNGHHEQALTLMNTAAAMEDQTEKHPVTPGELIPARELLGDMLLQMNQPTLALKAYEENLKKHPNRLNGLYGAAIAAQQSNDMGKASSYFRQLALMADPKQTGRQELELAKQFVQTHN